jgi:putative sigma-54 modulation protein
MKRYAEEKADKLPHHYDRIETADIILDHLSQTFKVEIVVRADHKHTFVAHADGSDFHEAYDIALDKMQRQLSRHKDKVRNRKHMTSEGGSSRPEAEV